MALVGQDDETPDPIWVGPLVVLTQKKDTGRKE